jgi:uncharacterized membrane protein
VADALVIFGLVLIGIGTVVLIVLTFRPTPQPAAAQGLPDVGEIVKQVRELLMTVEMRYRMPLILVLVGLAVAILGVYLKVNVEHATNHVAATLSGRYIE